MRLLTVFTANFSLSQCAKSNDTVTVDHIQQQSDIIAAFLAEPSGPEPERAVWNGKCGMSTIPNTIKDSDWKCNGKQTKCKLACTNSTKPPKTVYTCAPSGRGYEWVQKTSTTITDDLCEPPVPACGKLPQIATGVWYCNPQYMMCRLRCGLYLDEISRVHLKCNAKTGKWMSTDKKNPDFQKKMNCLSHSMYDTEMIGGFMVHIEEGMDKYEPRWRNLLTRDIERIVDALPGDALAIVSNTRIYLHKKYIYSGYGDSSGAAVYHPGAQWLINNGNLPEKVRCIDLMDVVKYVNGVLYHQPFMLLHEMTHAYQHRVYHEHGRLIRQTYQAAMDRGLYTGAYAAVNDWEYFAELTESFFSTAAWTNGREQILGNEAYPFDFHELRSYDSNGYRMAEKVWGISNAGRTGNLEPFCFLNTRSPVQSSHPYRKFDKYIRVLNCLDIYAEFTVSDDLVNHAAAVAAELLDNDNDGMVDDTAVSQALIDAGAMIPIFEKTGSKASKTFIKASEEADDNTYTAVLYADKMNSWYTGSALSKNNDITVKAILTTISKIGLRSAHPELFDTHLPKAMDMARGGYFKKAPKKYPSYAWFTNNVKKCDYDCMLIEYLSWGIMSNMGTLATGCKDVEEEWSACTTTDFRQRDVGLYGVLVFYGLPRWAPNGNYRRSSECN